MAVGRGDEEPKLSGLSPRFAFGMSSPADIRRRGSALQDRALPCRTHVWTMNAPVATAAILRRSFHTPPSPPGGPTGRGRKRPSDQPGPPRSRRPPDSRRGPSLPGCKCACAGPVRRGIWQEGPAERGEEGGSAGGEGGTMVLRPDRVAAPTSRTRPGLPVGRPQKGG